jgi:hypothetical protein
MQDQVSHPASSFQNQTGTATGTGTSIASLPQSGFLLPTIPVFRGGSLEGVEQH